VEAAGGTCGIAAVAGPCCRPADDSGRPQPGLGGGDRRRRPAALGPAADRRTTQASCGGGDRSIARRRSRALLPAGG
jgi:hypothetical protein